MTRERLRLVSGAAAVAAVACLLAALALFRGATAHAWGWRLYWIALALGAAAAWPWSGRPGTAPPVSRREAALLALVLLAGALFRADRLGSTPYGVWFDEAQNGLEAMRILAEPDYRPVFVPGISQLPALPFYYFAAFVDLFGPRIFALRLATTLVGLLAIVATWALGRALFGRRVGLLAAALLALSRWHVTFSRFAVANLAVTLFLPLAVLLFVRALSRRSPRDAVLCGMALGVGLQSYYAMFAGPVVLAALFALEWARGPARGRVPAALFALVIAVGALAYAPVLQYARTHPREYGQRLQATSFVKADSPAAAIRLLVPPSPRLGEAWSALGANLKAHALMFHVRGDANGRHNLPGAPMLDPVSGALFALGLLWCLARPFDPRRAALLLPFLAMMSAGVLSLTFEAPQGARTLGAAPFVALMGAVPLAAIARIAADRAGPRAGPATAGLALAIAGAWSWHLFDRQLRDPSAWESYSTPETRIAHVVREQGRDTDVYVTPTFAGGPTITFLLGQPLEASVFERSRDLPLVNRRRPALVCFPGSEEGTAAQIRAMYPTARVEAFGAPMGDGTIAHPVLWIARVPAEAIAGLAGWDVAAGEHRSRAFASEWDWATADPPFAARVEGTLRIADEAAYAFVVDGAPGTLAIDGETVLRPPAHRSPPLRLARGVHRVDLELPVTRRGQRVSLLWARGDGAPEPLPPDSMFSLNVPFGGLLGAYHADSDFAGEPVFRRIDPEVAFYFHVLPVPRPFSVRWTGSVYVPVAGVHGIGTSSVDGSSVAIDGFEVVSNRAPAAYVERTVELDAGWHAIEVRYQALTDYSQITLQWAPPGGPRARIPAAMLRPPGPSGRLVPKSAPAPAIPPPPEAAAPASRATGIDAAEPLVVTATRTLPPGEALRIAVARDGRAIVLDPGARRAILVPATGAPVPFVEPAGGWVDPSDVAVGSDGRFLVLDASGFVAVYQAPALVERILDLRRLGVYNPRGLGAAAGEILVADTGGGRVLVLDREGTLRDTIGRPGAGLGELVDPVDVARDGAGALVVVDVGNGRIQRVARDGSADAWPRAGQRDALSAERVDVDASGTAWVGGGGMREVWKLAPGQPPRRHALAAPDAPAGLAAGGGRLYLTAGRPSRILEVRVR